MSASETQRRNSRESLSENRMVQLGEQGSGEHGSSREFGGNGEAAFFDLDRTLLRGASTAIVREGLREHGLISKSAIPGERAALEAFRILGEGPPSVVLMRRAAAAAKGLSSVAFKQVGETVADRLLAEIEPFALEEIRQHRNCGRLVVMATASPADLVAPLADLLGMDELLATRYQVTADQIYSGSVDGDFAWSRGKARIASEWAAEQDIDLGGSYAYSDSFYDLPMLRLVGNPVAVNPDPRLLAYATANRWETRWFDVPPGVPKFLGVEPYDLMSKVFRPKTVPWMDLDIAGHENIPPSDGVIVASNHRSYIDPLVLGISVARAGRTARILSKSQLTDAPLIGALVRSLGAIRVDRENHEDDSIEAAASALRAGELVAIFPEGTIPDGHRAHEPELSGWHGAVRLALETGCPIVPMAVQGSEEVWPKGRRLPYVLNLANPPRVTVRVGEPYRPRTGDLQAATADLMSRIEALMPSASSS